MLGLDLHIGAYQFSAADDIQQPAVLRSLLKDLREVRQAKIRLGLRNEGVMRGSYLQVS
jgi:GINS complex subunit 2